VPIKLQRLYIDYTEMKKLFHPLLKLIATAANIELAKIIWHLDKLPKQVSLTDKER